MVALIPTAVLLFSALLPFSPVVAVKQEDFKKCDQASFCRRLRSLAPRQRESPDEWVSPYSIVGMGSLETFDEDDAELSSAVVFPVGSALYPEARFELKVNVGGDGIARIRLDEVGALRQRYNEAAKWTLVDTAMASHTFDLNTGEHNSNFTYTSAGEPHTLRITHDPIKIELFRDGEDTPEVVVNGRGLLHMEHYRLKGDGNEATTPAEPLVAASDEDEGQSVVVSEIGGGREWFEGDKEQWEKGMWEETFKSWTDPKIRGQSDPDAEGSESDELPSSRADLSPSICRPVSARSGSTLCRRLVPLGYACVRAPRARCSALAPLDRVSPVRP